ncbi:restriction endonuclease subunit S [Cobetia amphilecti]|uniref:restriction endonuclease subunit S n=1 Tax=Cobetia amphilecti TaxID=1055104 RepID=UPI002550C3B9|nr:restriction endonuclease subunit S [Cobetia amphilecti]
MSEQPHFPLQKLGEIVEVLDHLRIPVNSEARGKRKGDVPYYGANGLQGWIDEPLFNEPLILIAEDGGNFDDFSTRPIAYRIDGPAWVNNHAHIIKVDNPKLHSFIYWSVAHKDIRKHVAGGTRQKLNQSALKEIEIPCPPNDEGAVVGKVLDTLDTQIEKTEALIAKLEKVKEGLLHDLLTRGIDENGQLRPSPEQAPELYKQSRLGLIPKEWKEVYLNAVTEKITDGTHQAVKTIDPNDASIPFLYVSCIRNGRILWGHAAAISRDDFSVISKGREPHKGMVLYTAVGSYGHASAVETEELFAFQRHIACVSPDNKKINSRFISYFLNSSRVKRHADQVALGNAQRTVTLGELSHYPITLPSLLEQENISKRLSGLDSDIESLRKSLSKLTQQKAGLMDDLLTGCVRVTPLLEQAQATTPA